MNWPKQCGCGIEYTRDQWSGLACVGYQFVPGDEATREPPTAAELRNCSCGSTISVRVELETLTRLIECAPRTAMHCLYSSAARVAIEILSERLTAERRRVISEAVGGPRVDSSARGNGAEGPQ